MIEFINVSKSFGGKAVLQNESFSLQNGERMALEGISGSGKTTLFRILLGLEKPDGGTVTGLTGLKISCVFQEDRLLEHLSAVKNLTLTGVSETEAMRHLECVRLKGEEHISVSAFSGGMKRRVAIARAVAVKPDLLVLDEPFTGIDPETRKIVAEYIKTECPNAAVLLTTHEAGDRELLGITRAYSL